MVTKLIYFRPDKRFVKDDVLENKYTCLIKDKFTTAESSITVPIYLTVFQHHTPKNCMSQRKLRKESQLLSSAQFQEKLSFYLIGSNQLPPLHELTSDARNIDRIEFTGHIGFENPVFELIGKLSALRKITFSIYECKQGSFIFDADANADDGKDLICSPCNKMVTNLNIDVKKCEEKSCFIINCKNGNSSRNHHVFQENIHENCSGVKSNGEENRLETMLTRLLQRTAKQCPNIKRLTMDVPNSNNLRKVIDSFVQDMSLLKPTKICYINNRILVSKRGTETFQSEDDDNQTSGIIIEKHDDQPNNGEVITSDSTGTEQETASVPKMVDEIDIENADTLNSNSDSLEPTPCLFDMSKLLGSMLGIPTSSLPLPSLSSSSSSSSHSSSSSITQAPSNELLMADKLSTDTSPSESSSFNNDFQPVSASVEGSMNSTANNQQTSSVSISSSTMEVITYAAAAASAAATSANLTATTTCNGSGTTNRHHHNHSKNGGNDIGNHHRHHHHHHINEGSRRTFVKDGEGPGLRGDEDETEQITISDIANF